MSFFLWHVKMSDPLLLMTGKGSAHCPLLQSLVHLNHNKYKNPLVSGPADNLQKKKKENIHTAESYLIQWRRMKFTIQSVLTIKKKKSLLLKNFSINKVSVTLNNPQTREWPVFKFLDLQHISLDACLDWALLKSWGQHTKYQRYYNCSN